jgi:hypothetical protein
MGAERLVCEGQTRCEAREASNTPFMNFVITNGGHFENLRRLGNICRSEDPSGEDVATQLARMNEAEMVSSTNNFANYLAFLLFYICPLFLSPSPTTSTHPG